MRSVLPYFKPPYPAIKRFCQLCQSECGKDQYETQEVRDIDARAHGGQYIFCLRCSEIVGSIAELVEAERARLSVEHEAATEKHIQSLVQQAIADRTTSRAGVHTGSPPPSGANEAARIPPVRRRGTHIEH